MNRPLALLLVLLAACATQPAPGPAPVAAPVAQAAPECPPGAAILNATLWQQTAAEYDAVTLGIFANARRTVEAALADPAWTAEPQQTGDFGSLPPAVILDLDETAIDNGRFEARAILAGKTYDAKLWETWVHESAGGAVPGAPEFLAWLRSRGIKPFYITNRDTDEKAGTRANLEKLGYPLEDDNLLVRGEREEWKTSDKGPRRAWVASKYRVLALLGDDLNDFANARDKSREERDRIVQDNAARWGRQWFMLPNAIYGSWDRAITGGRGTPCEQFDRKMKALVP